jgi:hypothetical protein
MWISVGPRNPPGASNPALPHMMSSIFPIRPARPDPATRPPPLPHPPPRAPPPILLPNHNPQNNLVNNNPKYHNQLHYVPITS